MLFARGAIRLKGRTNLPRKPLPVPLVILLDLLGIGALLIIFILFHHVLQLDSSQPIRNIVFGTTSSPAVAATSTPEPSSSAAPTTAPASTPELGDFSASFPTSSSDVENAVGSYVTDNLRIVVTEKHTDDAVYFVADVWIRTIQEFKTAFANNTYGRGHYAYPYDMASQQNAVLAMSGDSYGSSSNGIVIRNGNLYRSTVSGDVCVLYADGTMTSYYEQDFNLDAAVARGAYQAWSFGPKLIDNGQIPASYNTTDTIIAHNPRSAIGYYEPGHYCFVVVDGRQSGYSRGMTLDELAQTMIDLGCVDAFNLDGGQSSMLVFQGSVVNQPYKEGREISDILYFGGNDPQ